MSQENGSVVRSLYDAFQHKDAAAVIELLDSEVEFRQSEEMPWGGSYRGHAGVLDFFNRLMTAIESGFFPDEYVDAGDHVVAIGHSRGRARTSGREFEVRAVHVWTIRDGKAVRFEAYIDHPAMREALGKKK